MTTAGDRLVVVDASALAALLFGEPDAAAVSDRLSGRRLTAPTLLRYEVASVFVKKRELYEPRADDLAEMLSLYPLLGIEEVQADASAVAALAVSTGLTAYDAAYLWTGRMLDAPVVTLDRRLAAAARDLGLPTG